MPQLWTCSLQAGEHPRFQPPPPPQKSPVLAFTQANFADGNATHPIFISHSLSPLFWAPAVCRLSRTSPGDFWQGEDVLWSDSSCGAAGTGPDHGRGTTSPQGSCLGVNRAAKPISFLAQASAELFTGCVNTMDTMPANAQGLNQSPSNEPCELLWREEGASPPCRAARAPSCPWSWTHSVAPCAAPCLCVSSKQTDRYIKYVPINRNCKLVHVQHTCCWWLSTCSWGAAAPIWLLSSDIKSLQESSSSS